MRRGICIAALFAALSWGVPANAAMTGEKLKDWCGGEQYSVKFAVCLGYLNALVDIIGDPAKPFGLSACFPKDATIVEIADIVKAYLENNPGKGKQTAAALGMAALVQAYPCDK